MGQPSTGSGTLFEFGNAYVLVIFLLTMYLFPTWILGQQLYVTDGAKNSSWIFDWFQAFSVSNLSDPKKNDATTLNEVHQLLLPLISGISVVVFRSKNARFIQILSGFVLINFFYIVYLEVYISIENVKNNFPGVGISISDVGKFGDVLRRIRESLLMYSAILIGIRISK
jgi:hypothetical protein